MLYWIKMDNDVKYPRRGEYGPTQGRCKWCGKESVGHWGMYCSRKCASAGSIYSTVFLTVVAFAFEAWALSVFNVPAIVFFAIMSCVFVYYSYAGLRMRHRS
jgi:hypothetical protein